MSAEKDDEKLLISRINDALAQADRRWGAVYIGFLNECQAHTAAEYLKRTSCGNFMFFGGHKSALRTMLCIYNADSNPPEYTDFPITALRFGYRTADFLGAVMALGVKRESIGDIIVRGGFAVMFAEKNIASYLLGQIQKIGSVGVGISVCEDGNLDFPQEYETAVINVSSMRLDSFVAAVTKLSRTKAAALISSGLVSVNYSVNQKADFLLSENDTVSVRKKGKYVVAGILGTTKKDRLRVSVRIIK